MFPVEQKEKSRFFERDFLIQNLKFGLRTYVITIKILILNSKEIFNIKNNNINFEF